MSYLAREDAAPRPPSLEVIRGLTYTDPAQIFNREECVRSDWQFYKALPIDNHHRIKEPLPLLPVNEPHVPARRGQSQRYVLINDHHLVLEK